MTSRILATASVIAIAFGTAASAETLPSWDPRTICTEDSTPQHCSFLEGQARAQISQQWAFIPTRVRAQCLASNEEQRTESWRAFGDCLADAAKGPAAGGSGNDSVQVADASGSTGSGGDMDALRAELDAANARIAELEAAQGGDAGDDKVTELEAELEKTRTAARSSEVRIEGLQQRLLSAIDAQDSGGDTEAMQAAIDKAEARARGAEFRSKALQATLMETIAGGKTSKSELEGKLSSAETDVKRGLARIEGLQGRLMEMQDSAEASDDDGEAAEMIADLKARMAVMQEISAEDREQSLARIAALEEQLAEASADAAADDGAMEKVAALEADLAKATASVRSGEVRIEGLQKRLIEAMDREDVSSDGGADATALQGQLATAQSRIENLQSRLRASRDALKGAERDRGVATSNLINARTRIAALQDAMIESRRAAAEAPTGSEAEAKAIANGERLQRLLDNQRDRAERVGQKVAEQRGRIRELESEVRSLRRSAQSAVNISCQQRMNDVVTSGGIQFANNKAEIRADAATTIDRLIAIASDCGDSKITVKGHTDTSGERSYNLQLSQRRADAVAAYMERSGINRDRIEAVGVGPDEPIADNNTRAGRTQNRRIEILIE